MLKGLKGFSYPFPRPRITVHFRRWWSCVGAARTIETSICSPLFVGHLQTKNTIENFVNSEDDETMIDVARHTNVDIDRHRSTA
ncbi:hypothetical protein F2Q68_00039937 [Brassica cretica]|uniref:Uncharacterized protein n=1 Tax=Brassica cretica TaxID=69181 RepID=A0A8S9MD96_BRACR|nr:hypothetical protein F2Q68_00039937 [Brassica cretica]